MEMLNKDITQTEAENTDCFMQASAHKKNPFASPLKKGDGLGTQETFPYHALMNSPAGSSTLKAGGLFFPSPCILTLGSWHILNIFFLPHEEDLVSPTSKTGSTFQMQHAKKN